MISNNLPQSVTISSRISRASYGVQMRRLFIPKTDPVEKRVWSSTELEWKIDAIEWFLEIVSEDWGSH